MTSERFAVAEAPVPVAGEPAAPSEPPARRGWTGGRIALVVVGSGRTARDLRTASTLYERGRLAEARPAFWE